MWFNLDVAFLSFCVSISVLLVWFKAQLFVIMQMFLQEWFGCCIVFNFLTFLQSSISNVTKILVRKFVANIDGLKP